MGDNMLILCVKNVWHEAADYSSDQIMFQTGQIIGGSASDKSNFKILDRTGKRLYSVAIDQTNWQNFAVKLDYNKKYVLFSLYSFLTA
jgi:hypothetical protein